MPAAERKHKTGMDQARILIVDDDPLTRRLIAVALSGYSLTEAESGGEALEEIARLPFDLVILDLMMPGIDGLETIRRIREKHPCQRMMVVSSFGTEENLLATLRERVVDFLVKPFSTDQLENAVSNLLASEGAIEVISAHHKWIELRVPASFQVAASLDSYFSTLQGDIDAETRGRVSTAFRELINNAIEHGCKGDPEGKVEVACIRLKRGILYRIKDPGGGFDFGSLPHAAVSNPQGDPVRHQEVRQQLGMRPGGYGILWLQQLADELVYNASGNEVIFVKYL